eukprot:8147928-Pyramimonas_sp.AAC.1
MSTRACHELLVLTQAAHTTFQHRARCFSRRRVVPRSALVSRGAARQRCRHRNMFIAPVRRAVPRGAAVRLATRCSQIALGNIGATLEQHLSNACIALEPRLQHA